MEIKKLCYDLYKLKWKEEHCTYEQIKELTIDYHLYTDDYDEFTYEDYLNEFGYNGELYADFYEFETNEYLDEEYMKNLLRDNIDIYEKYLQDVGYEKDEEEY